MHVIIAPYICLARVTAPWRHHKSAVPSANLFGPSGEAPRAGLSCPAGSGHYSSSPSIPPSVSEWRSWEDELVVVNSIAQWFSSLCWVLEFFVRNTIFDGNVNSKAASGAGRGEGGDAPCISWTRMMGHPREGAHAYVCECLSIREKWV